MVRVLLKLFIQVLESSGQLYWQLLCLRYFLESIFIYENTEELWLYRTRWFLATKWSKKSI